MKFRFYLSLYIAAAILVMAIPAGAQDDGQEKSFDLEPFATDPDEGEGKPYAVKELVGIAQKNAAVLREHTARINKAQWQQYRADWAWGPKLRADFLLAPVPERADVDKFSSNLDQYLALNIGPLFRSRADIAIPLWTFDRITIAQDLADLGVDAAKLQREKARYDLMYQVKRAYYSVQLANAFHELLNEGSSILKEKLADMEEARDFGEAEFSTKDFRKLQIFNAEFDGRVLDNRQLHDIAVAGVRYFTRVQNFRVAKFDDEKDPPALKSMAEYMEVARANRPDLKLLGYGVRARSLQVDMAESEFYPNIALAFQLGFGWSTEDIELKRVCRRPSAGAECVDTADLFARPYSNPFNFNSFGVALVMEWNFDFWQLRGKYGEAKAERATTIAQRERAVGAIELEVQKLFIDARQALEKLRVEERRLDAARRWRDQFGLSVESAGADIEEGIDPLKAYFEAKAKQLEARYNYQVARAALAKGIGVEWLEIPAEAQASNENDE